MRVRVPYDGSGTRLHFHGISQEVNDLVPWPQRRMLRAGDDGAEVVEGVPSGEVASLRSYPRLGTLIMRLSISRTPAISWATFCALSRTSPLLEMPTRATLPSAAETVIPAGAAS